jgi:benzoate-CoA ligase family protein
MSLTATSRRLNAASDLLDRHLADPAQAARIAVTDDAGAYSFAALSERVNRAGNALAALGVRREERVLLSLEDSVDFHAAFLGAMKIGAVPVPINTLLTAEDQGYLLHDSRATAVVVSERLHGKLQPALANAPALRTAVVSGGQVPGLPRFSELLSAASPSLAAADTSPDDMAFWLYSSGSTGRPKGAVHLHSHIGQTASLYGEGVLGVRATDVVFSAAKLFFAYGLGNALTFPLHSGARSVLRAARPTPELVLQTLARESVTIFGGVPTLFASLLAYADAQGAAALPRLSLRCCISAGEALPKEIGERWRARFGVDILDGIGSTEMLHIFISNRHGDVRYGSSGTPVPGYQAKLLDDQGREIEGEGEGQLWVSGPSAAAAYWNNRAHSLATFQGPWTRTGDVYRRDADGVFTYGGRSDDMLKVGGIWVSPFEVESALLGHPSVLEAAVVGCADSDELIKPKAFVVLKDAGQASPALEAELKAFVKARLAPYKYPRWIEFTRELPRTATGKIQRFKLRA